MNKIDKIDKIYVLTHKPLVDRRNKVQKQLNILDLDVEWIDSFLPEEIDYEKEVEGWEKFDKIDIIHPYGEYANFSKKVSLSELSLYLKHKECLIKQVENNYNNILIFEDDIDLSVSLGYLNNHINEFQSKVETDGANMLILGTAFNFKPTIINGEFIHYNKYNLTRCTHAYVVNINCTKIILDRLSTVTYPIDFKLNEIMTIDKLNVYWSHPGMTQTSLNNNTSTIIK